MFTPMMSPYDHGVMMGAQQMMAMANMAAQVRVCVRVCVCVCVCVCACVCCCWVRAYDFGVCV